MDLLLWAWHNDVPAAEAGAAMGLEGEQVERVYRDIVAKRRVAERLSRDAETIVKVPLDGQKVPTAGA
jgi:NAD+ synthase